MSKQVAPAHRPAYTVDGAEGGELVRGVLAAAVAVENDAVGGFADHEGGSEGLDDEAGTQVVGDGVADHLAGVQVDHGRGVDPAVDGLDVGDVAALADVGFGCGEVLPDQVRCVNGPLTCDGRFLPGMWVTSAQASGLHQAPDPLGGDLDAAHDELRLDSAHAGWPCRVRWISRIVSVSSASVRSRSHGPSANHR